LRGWDAVLTPSCTIRLSNIVGHQYFTQSLARDAVAAAAIVTIKWSHHDNSDTHDNRNDLNHDWNHWSSCCDDDIGMRTSLWQLTWAIVTAVPLIVVVITGLDTSLSDDALQMEMTRYRTILHNRCQQMVINTTVTRDGHNGKVSVHNNVGSPALSLAPHTWCIKRTVIRVIAACHTTGDNIANNSNTIPSSSSSTSDDVRSKLCRVSDGFSLASALSSHLSHKGKENDDSKSIVPRSLSSLPLRMAVQVSTARPTSLSRVDQFIDGTIIIIGCSLSWSGQCDYRLYFIRYSNGIRSVSDGSTLDVYYGIPIISTPFPLHT
jgi:hypothetical protein